VNGDPRHVQSGVARDGTGTCKFRCAYCFASDPAYRPGESVHAPDFQARVESDGTDVLMLAADTELFHNPQAALRTLEILVTAGKDLTFSTKMHLPSSIIERLVAVQEKLRARGNILAVMVSIPLVTNSAALEQLVAPVEARLQLVSTLRQAGLLPFVGIRPLLPPPLLPDDDVPHIVDRTVETSLGYIMGPYWFEEDRFGLLHRDLPIVRRPVPWMAGTPDWYVYEDKAREQRFAEVIVAAGGVLYERSSEAVRGIKRRLEGLSNDPHTIALSR
jgi:DNA repair photolyase